MCVLGREGCPAMRAFAEGAKRAAVALAGRLLTDVGFAAVAQPDPVVQRGGPAAEEAAAPVGLSRM